MKNKQLTKTNNYARHLALSVLLVFGMFFSVNAQTDIEVSGTVTGATDGLPIPGVAVIIKGTGIGAATDFDGNYTIGAKLGDILEFSGIGFKTLTQKVTGEKLDVKIEEEVQNLGETVLIGYGKVEKKEVTGAVAQIKAEQIEDFVTADLASALQGQIAGVNINADTGEPGEPASISIRGVSSLTGSNNPLFVVDGIAFDEDPNLNPNEIETIDVLKDAASASIYGTRGAGGVIIITTKKGKEGKNTIDFDVNIGVQDIPSRGFVDLLNLTDQLFVNEVSGANERANNSSRFNLTNESNIEREILNENALTQRYNLRFSGGSKGFNYSTSGGYFKQEGAVTGSIFERYNLRSNFRIKKNKWAINTGFGFTIEDRDLIGDGLLATARNLQPTSGNLADFENFPVNGDGNFAQRDRLTRFFNAINANDNSQNRFRFDINNKIDYKITKDLTFTNTFGGAFTTFFRTASTPDQTRFLNDNEEDEPNFEILPGDIREGVTREQTLNLTTGFNYDKEFGKHSFKLIALGSVEEFKARSFAARVEGLPEGSLNTFDNAGGETAETSPQVVSNSGTVPELNAFVRPDQLIRRLGLIGRVIYNYDKRYILSVSVRRDGSSQFGPDFRFNTFPSVSAAWNISEEEFWEPYKGVVNDLKLRASRGTTGNDRVPSFEFFERANSTAVGSLFNNNSNINDGILLSQASNTALQWETTVQTNFGVDLALFKNALTISMDYYNSEKEDLLLGVETPGSAGFGGGSTTQNVGNLVNSGFEYAVNYRGKINKDFKFNIGGTLTKNTSIVEELANGVELIDLTPIQGVFNSEFRGNNRFRNSLPRLTSLIRGQEPGTFRLFRTDGLFRTQQEVDDYTAVTNTDNSIFDAEVGNVRIVDVNGDGVIDQNDRESRGSGQPRFEGGLNLGITFKQFSLNSSWVGSYGNEVLNGARFEAFNDGRARDLLFQFDPVINPDANLQQTDGRLAGNTNFASETDLFLEDGSFIRLRNIVFTYRFHKKILEKLSLSAASLSITGQNLVTFTEYSGFNPSAGGNNIIARGIDRSAFPLARSYNVGLKVRF